MERAEVLDMMNALKLYGMRNAYDETLATAVKRQHEPQHFVGDLLNPADCETIRRRRHGGVFRCVSDECDRGCLCELRPATSFAGQQQHHRVSGRGVQHQFDSSLATSKRTFRKLR